MATPSEGDLRQTNRISAFMVNLRILVNLRRIGVPTCHSGTQICHPQWDEVNASRSRKMMKAMGAMKTIRRLRPDVDNVDDTDCDGTAVANNSDAKNVDGDNNICDNNGDDVGHLR